MGWKQETEQRSQEEREVAFLVDPQPNFVSLVSRGANQTPFRVVKHQKSEEGSVPMKILHSIIAPKDVDEDVIKDALGEDASQVVKLDQKAERGDMVAYEQVARERFKDDSFELVTLDAERSIKGIQGELAEEESGNVLTRMFKPTKKTEAIEVDHEADDMEAVKNQLTEEVYMEMMKTNDAVAGILAQEKGDPKGKLKAVKQVIKNLTDYIEEALLVTKGGTLDVATKMEEARQEDSRKGESENAHDATPNEGEVSEDGESAEKGENAGEEEETPAEDREQQPDANQVVKDALDEMKSHLDEAIAKLDEKIEGMDQRVGAVEGSVEKINKRVPGAVRSHDADDVTTETKHKSENGGTFRGTLFGG